MKRFLDVFFSLLLILLLSPLLLLIGILILIDDGFPIIFHQARVGKDNALFQIRKFRTMKNGTRNAATSELKESERQITRSGKFLRRTSLDELPQLINILQGSMSFVGPRPLIPEETEIRKLRAEYNVYSVRPGVTGWAQINGRDHVSLEEKARFDQEYIEKQSLRFDIKIFFKTVLVVFRRENVLEGGEQGAPQD